MSVSYGGDSITFADGSVQSGGWTGFKNRVINGAMTVSQRYANTNTSVAAGASTYTPDRFRCDTYSSGQTIFVQQVTDAPAGFNKSLKITIGTANSSPSSANSDFCGTNHLIEGYNVADLNWGTSSAKTITVSFWVKCSSNGTFGVSYDNYKINSDGDGGGQDNVYVSTYTINSANTWEYKTITIPGCQTGVWGKTNDRGLNLRWCLGASSGTTTGSPNTWLAGSANYQRTSACVQLAATSGATWQITGVQCEIGSTASSFEWRPYTTELALCQRYFAKSYDIATAVGTATRNGYVNWNFQNLSNYGVVVIYLPVRMRAAPTSTNYNPDLTNTVGGRYWNGSAEVAFTGSMSGWTNYQSNIQFNKDGTNSTNMLIQWTADAEL